MSIPKPRRAIARISPKKLAKNGGKYPRSTIPSSSKAPRKRKRKPSETLRIYGTPARRRFVRSLPCAACGVRGYSVQAHVLGNGGTGRKADADTIAPLCGERWRGDSFEIGCHTLFDEHRWQFDISFPSFDSVEAARTCELAWEAFQNQEQEEG